jgi:hypothetical protein
MEQLTGFPASQMIGTNHQWVPFWDSERPSMADVILDQKERPGDLGPLWFQVEKIQN